MRARAHAPRCSLTCGVEYPRTHVRASELASERASVCACVRALFDVRLQVCALTRDTL